MENRFTFHIVMTSPKIGLENSILAIIIRAKKIYLGIYRHACKSWPLIWCIKRSQTSGPTCTLQWRYGGPKVCNHNVIYLFIDYFLGS